MQHDFCSKIFFFFLIEYASGYGIIYSEAKETSFGESCCFQLNKADKKELSGMQGKWKSIKTINRGIEISNEEITVIIKGEQFIAKEGTSERIFTISLNPLTKPKSIDLLSADSMYPIRGIYEIDQKSLKICWSIIGPRPSEYRSSEKTESVLIFLKKLR